MTMLGITLWVIIYEPNVHDFFLKINSYGYSMKIKYLIF
jgi:hypothetical protein